MFLCQFVFQAYHKCFQVNLVSKITIYYKMPETSDFVEIIEMFASLTAESAVRTVEPICLPGPKPNFKRIIIYKL